MPISPSDPLTSLLRSNIVMPGLPGTLSADDSIAAKQSALRAHVLGALSTIVSAPGANAVLLDTGQLAAGTYRVRCLVKGSPQVAAVDKGVVLQHRDNTNAANVELPFRVAALARGGAGYCELVLTLAANERIRLVQDATAADSGSEVLVVLDVSPLESNAV